jgi:hypothetical protein
MVEPATGCILSAIRRWQKVRVANKKALFSPRRERYVPSPDQRLLLVAEMPAVPLTEAAPTASAVRPRSKPQPGRPRVSAGRHFPKRYSPRQALPYLPLDRQPRRHSPPLHREIRCDCRYRGPWLDALIICGQREWLLLRENKNSPVPTWTRCGAATDSSQPSTEIGLRRSGY